MILPTYLTLTCPTLPSHTTLHLSQTSCRSLNELHSLIQHSCLLNMPPPFLRMFLFPLPLTFPNLSWPAWTTCSFKLSLQAPVLTVLLPKDGHLPVSYSWFLLHTMYNLLEIFLFSSCVTTSTLAL